MHIHLVIAVSHHAIAHDACIAIAKFVILFNNTILVFVVVGGNELLLTEPLSEVEEASFVGFLHCTLDLAVAQHLVAVDIDFMDANLRVLVNHDVNNHLVLLAQVFLLNHLNGGLVEALVGKILLNDNFNTVGNVRCHLVAWGETQTLNHVLLLATLHAQVVHLRDTGLLLKVEFEPSLVAIHLFHLDLHLGEQALTPEALSGVLDVFARNFHALTNRKPRIADDNVIFIVVGTSHFNSCNLIFRVMTGEYHFRIVDGVVHCVGFLCFHACGKRKNGYEE